MRVILPESAPQRKRSPLGAVSSAVIHAALIGGTVVATGWTAEKPLKRTPPIEVLRLFPPREPPKPAPRSSVKPPDIATNVTPDERTPPIIPYFHVPDSLPAIDIRIGTMTVDSFARSPMSLRPGAPDGAPHPANNVVLTEATVEKAVVPLPGNRPPRYPIMLANAGVEGKVVMQFVVDTMGRVESGSMMVISSSQPQFQESVRDALTRARFVPAEYAGHRVRQLVEQAFTFALSRR